MIRPSLLLLVGLGVVLQNSLVASQRSVGVVRLPQFKAATPRYVQTGTTPDLRLKFEDGVMNMNTKVTLMLRGAGYWDQPVVCENVNAVNVTCPLPRFSLAGDLDIRVKFNATTRIKNNPFLPLGFDITVWDAALNSVEPIAMPKSSRNRTISVSSRGLFQSRGAVNVTNLMVKLDGEQTVVLPRNQYILRDANSLLVNLPVTLPKGKFAVFVSVDAGASYISCDLCAFQIYDPSYDSKRLALSPIAGPIDGGTEVTVQGVYGMLLLENEPLIVTLETNILTPNGTRVFRIRAPVKTSDQLKPYVVLGDKPTFTFVTPPTPVAGFYSISIGHNDYSTLIPVNFLYYKINVTRMTPTSSLVKNPAQTVTVCLPGALPQTKIFRMRYREVMTNSRGSTFTEATIVDCKEKLVPVPPKTQLERCTVCPLPSLAVSPRHGSVLSIDVTANGVDYSSLPVKEFAFYDASVTGVAPLRGPMKSQTLTISGHNFIVVPDVQVKLVLLSAKAEKIVPARFVGENRLEFTLPDYSTLNPKAPVGGTDTLSLFLLPTGDPDVSIPLPSYTYDMSRPIINSITLDSGNRLSPSTSSLNSTLSLRIVAASADLSFSLSKLSVGTTVVPLWLPSLVTKQDGALWTLSYPVRAGDTGEVGFEVKVVNPSKNVLVVNERSPGVDKKIIVDTRVPKVLVAKVLSSNAQFPTRAKPGHTISILLTFDVPLAALKLTSFTIGDSAIALQECAVLSIGGYPSANWKVLYTVPTPLPGVGKVGFRLSAMSAVGNRMKDFSEKDAAVQGSVKVDL